MSKCKQLYDRMLHHGARPGARAFGSDYSEYLRREGAVNLDENCEPNVTTGGGAFGIDESAGCPGWRLSGAGRVGTAVYWSGDFRRRPVPFCGNGESRKETRASSVSVFV